MKNSTVKGAVLVALGAASYGMLTTFVTMANQEGYTTFELTFSQYLIGFVGLLIADLIRRKQTKTVLKTPGMRSKRNLILAGTTLGATSFIYYLSVQYVSVSVAIVLLMQSVWISVVLDAFINKTKPGAVKLFAVGVILGGTVLVATNLLFESVTLDWRGLALGFLAAISYSITIFTTNSVGLELSSITRSKWMTLGALILVSLITIPFIINSFHPDVLFTWGLLLGALGTFMAPLFLNAGMPKVNLGVGAIITSMELPVAVSLAYFLLHEPVNPWQAMGIILILVAVVVMNIKKSTR